MAVVKVREVRVEKKIEDVFKRIEGFFRKAQEVIITSSTLEEETGSIIITFNKSIVSMGEVMTVNLTKVEENITEIYVESTSTGEKTVYDWGKNEKNIRLVLELFGLEEKNEKKRLPYTR